MVRKAHVFQIFLASPSDVSDERALLETVIAELNQVWSSNLGISFELVKWETNVHPSFSSDPQAVINQQISPTYDIFIGILWGRIGTPTPRAESGTIEEFESAYARLQADGTSPEIMLYFKEAPISPSKIDVDQMGKLQAFRRSLSDRGGLYSVFEDQASFESSVRAHLSAMAQKFSAGLPADRKLTLDAEISPAQEAIAINDEDDYGYIDYIEIYESQQLEMNNAITAINEATERVGEQLSRRTVEMRGGQPSDPKAARHLIQRAADDMNSYSETLAVQVAIMSFARKKAFGALSNALALQGEFGNKNEDLASFQLILHRLIDSILFARQSMTEMRSSTNALPRISKELNQAKRVVVARLDEFLAEIDSTSATVTNIVEAIDRMLAPKH